MSKRAWLTFDEIPAERVCRYLVIPNGWQWEAAFRGALLLLTESENWEQFGALTPDEMAQAWTDVFINYIEGSAECAGGSVAIPTGSVLAFAGSDAPDGFLLCDGTALSTAEYPGLFSVIGYTFGGSGESFTLPDLRGRMLAFAGAGAGLTPRAVGDVGGEEAHTLTQAEIPPITSVKMKNGAGTDGQWAARGSAAASQYEGNWSGAWPTLAGQAHENMPPFLVLNAIIKT